MAQKAQSERELLGRLPNTPMDKRALSAQTATPVCSFRLLSRAIFIIFALFVLGLDPAHRYSIPLPPHNQT